MSRSSARDRALLALALLIAACDGPTGTRRDAGRVDAGEEPGLDAGAGFDAGPPPDAPPLTDAGDVCGDETRGITEACEDGNTTSFDGCSGTCETEIGFRCPSAPGPCRAIVCGDGRIEFPEVCDDGNASAGDGCSDVCEPEAGWDCPVAGVPCRARDCGDGVRAGLEGCDDGNTASGDGCSDRCTLEVGFTCPTPGLACAVEVCGDGVRRGLEQCDDGNVRAFDGCDPACHNEPSCVAGVCSAVCGDGVILPMSDEACDDGNTLAGDGCSPRCEVEPGFTCTLAPAPLPDALRVPVVYRDMRGVTQAGSPTHPDFDTRGGMGITFDMVTDTLDRDGRPVFSGLVVGGAGSLDAGSFADWYRDSFRNRPVLDALTLTRSGTTYAFDTTAFFPIDGRGWNAPGSTAPESYPEPHNYSFTTEAHTWFVFQGDERLEFRGDDDVWVFVDGHLCLDVGGLHPPESGVMDLGNPASAGDARQVAVVSECAARLVRGRVYELVVFHAERHCCGSNFRLTLTGFETQTSACVPRCGDGVVTRDELCDDGDAGNTGGYGRCAPDCLGRGPYCGDGAVEAGVEACDDGAGLNDGRYGGCNPDCTAGPRCGDGVRQGAEQCDAGAENGTAGSGCDAACALIVI